ncbi:ATP-binding protein [Veronia pacifica]|uniref:Sensory/regulatory protein RpfC n=1 Tax=Veronia pacifica TaxID=1080227 RepID=A0A1C3ECG4_9GAMM|nr:ATP-binding protein [Veronia pacifica]ODA30947.1 hypothetical protein A8L45_18605 [Veronia pacifica]
MSVKRFQRYTGKPYLKGIVAKVGMAMAIMTILVTVISASSYVMLKDASQDTHDASRRVIFLSLMSSSLVRFSAEMNTALVRYSIGDAESADVFRARKKSFELALQDLKAEYANEAVPLQHIEKVFNTYVKEAEETVIKLFNPKSEQWVNEQQNLIKSNIVEKIRFHIREIAAPLDVANKDQVRQKLYLDELLMQSEGIFNIIGSHINGSPTSKRNAAQTNADFYHYLGLYQGAFGSTPDLEAIVKLYEQLNKNANQIFDAYDPSGKSKVIAASNALTKNAYGELIESLTSLSEDNSTIAVDTLSDQQKILKTNQTSFLALFGIIAFASVVITLSVYRNVTRPIAKLADTMFQLSQGNTEIPIMFRDRRDEVGQISFALSLFRDHIISRNQAREQLVYQKERAESASIAKAQFLAAMSHEIRTPMNGVIGMIDILRRSNLDATQLGLANTVRESALTLLGIINDILDFSRIEAGKMSLDKVPFYIRSIAEQVMDNFAAEAMSKNVKLALYVDTNIPDNLLGDPIRIKQILFNLIGNGIKFSSRKEQSGMVQVWIFLENSDENDSHADIKIEVRDNGIGISKEKLAAIFQPFTQAEFSTTRRYGGSGLGLAISRNIINMLNGDISVSSEEGFGTSFTVNFALERSQETAPADYVASYKEQVNGLEGFVIIDTLNSGPLHTMVNKYLNHIGLEPRTIPIHQLARDPHSFDNDKKYIIVCDDYLFTKNQLEYAKNTDLRYLEMDTRLPVHKYGATDVFSIHASPLKLTLLINGLLICAGIKSPDFPVFHRQQKESLKQPALINKGHILVAEDNLTNQVVIEKQLNYLGYKVTMTENGVEAEQAYRKDEFDIVLTDCHMPEMDGYELTRRLREIQKGDGIRVPVIALTANVLVGEADKCFEAGMDDFISKPVEMGDIEGVLDKWLQNEGASADDTPNPIDTDVPSSLLKPGLSDKDMEKFRLRANVLEKLFWGDEATYLAVLNEFNKHCVPELSGLSESDPPFNFEEIKQAAHKLKTSTSSVGADHLSQLCQKIEIACREESPDTLALLSELKRDLPTCLRIIEDRRLNLEKSVGSQD